MVARRWVMKFGMSGIARAPKRECWSRSSNNVGMIRILGFQHIVDAKSFSISLIDNSGVGMTEWATYMHLYLEFQKERVCWRGAPTIRLKNFFFSSVVSWDHSLPTQTWFINSFLGSFSGDLHRWSGGSRKWDDVLQVGGGGRVCEHWEDGGMGIFRVPLL